MDITRKIDGNYFCLLALIFFFISSFPRPFMFCGTTQDQGHMWKVKCHYISQLKSSTQQKVTKMALVIAYRTHPLQLICFSIHLTFPLNVPTSTIWCFGRYKIFEWRVQWSIKNQLDATLHFIVRLIGSTYFEHYYAQHQELAAMLLITTLVVSVLVFCMLEVR